MRTITTLLAVLLLAVSTVAGGDEETPRADRAAPPAASQAADDDLSKAPVDWREVASALKAGSGAIAFFLGLALLCGVGWGVLAMVLAVSPNLTERVGKAMHASRVKCFVIGLAGFVFLVSLCAVSQNTLAVVALPVLLVGALWGWCGVCEDVGRRAFMLTTRDPGRLAKLSLGWPVFYLSSLVPFVGWLSFAVLSLCGLGAFFIALLAGRARSAARAVP